MGIYSYRGILPEISPTAFIAEGAHIIGDVHIGPGASVWFNAVLRGDVNRVELGAGSNVQDGAVVHCDSGFDTVIGDHVTVGHQATVHGCHIGSHTLIGMGAILLNGVRLGEGCLVAAGALLLEGREYPSGSMIVGVPGKVVRTLSPAELAKIRANVRVYQGLAAEYLADGSAHQLRKAIE